MPDLLDIVGQDAAIARLQQAIAGSRRPHAYLFAGPEGVGRETTAVEFAKLLLCHQPAARRNAAEGGESLLGKTAPGAPRLPQLPADFTLRQACGRCPACLTLAAGTNGDFHLIYKELARYHDEPQVRDRVMQDLSIDVVRQFLIAPAYRAAAGGRGKAFVVRGAEEMSIPAQNSLLKTLEEPPAGVTLILVTAAPAELLPTTRSRCHLVQFGALPAEFVTARLTQAGVAAAEANFWAGLTEGSLGRSLQLAEAGLYEFKRQLVDRLAGLPGKADATFADTLTKEMEKQAKKLVRRDEGLAESLAKRLAGQTILNIIASVYRDALMTAAQSTHALVHADQAAAVGKIAAAFGPSTLAEILDQLGRFEQFLWRNANAKILWDNVAVTCAWATPLEV